MEQIKTNQSGQALVEYILLLGILVGIYTALLNRMSQTSVMQVMQKPLTKDFAYTYRYGNLQARGQDDGGPLYIPQFHDDQNNFRIFINPPINQ